MTKLEQAVFFTYGLLQNVVCCNECNVRPGLTGSEMERENYTWTATNSYMALGVGVLPWKGTPMQKSADEGWWGHAERLQQSNIYLIKHLHFFNRQITNQGAKPCHARWLCIEQRVWKRTSGHTCDAYFWALQPSSFDFCEWQQSKQCALVFPMAAISAEECATSEKIT